MIRFAAGLALAASLALSQPQTMTQGPHRMEIILERLDGSAWKTIDPGHILAQGDRVRFRFRTNFDGYLYVTNQSTSGKYEQLFPRAETGQDNRVAASQDYQVPSTSSVFRIAGPAGYETVYWLVSPGRLTDAPPAPAAPSAPHNLIPRCDDTILRARGDCVDSSAGPKPLTTPDPAATRAARDLVFIRQKETAVISSPAPLTGPVIYQFRLAHK